MASWIAQVSDSVVMLLKSITSPYPSNIARTIFLLWSAKFGIPTIGIPLVIASSKLNCPPWVMNSRMLGWAAVYVINKCQISKLTVKVKQSHYRSGQGMRGPGIWDSQISRQLAHECTNDVNPTHWPRLPPRNFHIIHFP